MSSYWSYREFCEKENLNNVTGWKVVYSSDINNCSSYPEDHYDFYAKMLSGEEIKVYFSGNEDDMKKSIYFTYKSSPKAVAKNLVNWTKEYLNSFGGDTKAVIGISGGKDSTVALKVLIEAVGRDRIYAVNMPHRINGIEPEVEMISKEFNIPIHYVYVQGAYDALTSEINMHSDIATDAKANSIYKSNTPCRLRMVTLYSIAALLGNARVVCTSNRSEDYIGWATKFGDMAGDFAPLADLTVREVKQVGYTLGISKDLIEKKPDDGMCGATDEEKFGFTYEELDKFLLGEEYPVESTAKAIDIMHKRSAHKFKPMPKFENK